ncbi:MAG: hypothetical protein NUV77_05240 [Thermoguttaceae bacterium]|jgi:histidinol phosphatase-like PHP family hydrolase|nr:hypothetical protein [Thermoguttaceae bacterium]
MVTRRALLRAGIAGVGLAAARGPARGAEPARSAPRAEAIPRVDLHVHLDNSTIDLVADLSRRLGVRFGVVEHAGTRENKYPVILSNDDELRRWLESLEGKGVYRGVQAEWTDWPGCFSRAMLARLDYVLTDAMTFPGKDGRRVKLWEKDVGDRVDLADPEKFMDRFVDWHIEIVERQPIHILANTSWLPAPLAAQYDVLWTPARVRRVAQAAAKHGVALEISSGYRLPKPPFLRIAREAGVKFSFGSNGRYPNMGKIDYCLAMAKELGLSAADIFTPVTKAK